MKTYLKSNFKLPRKLVILTTGVTLLATTLYLINKKFGINVTEPDTSNDNLAKLSEDYNVDKEENK